MKAIVLLPTVLTTLMCATPVVVPSPAQTTCSATTTRDASGVITAGGDIGLLEIRPSGSPARRVMVLVRRGSRLGDQLAIRATGLASSARGEVHWSEPAKPHANAWGDVVFEANTKPIGIGCWRIGRDGGPGDGIIVDLGR